MRIAVTGATGSVGTAVLRRLRDEHGLGWTPTSDAAEVVGEVVSGMVEYAHGPTPAPRRRTARAVVSDAVRSGPVSHRPRP